MKRFSNTPSRTICRGANVLALFTHLGEVVVEHNGNLKVTRRGHVLILPSPRTKDVTTTEELMKLRHFLGQSETARPAANPPAAHLLVVIDHHAARLFRAELRGAVPELILPYEADGHLRQAHPARDFFSGKEKAAPGAFFEPVARALKGAEKILIFGTGTGASSEMAQFTAWLKKHHADLAGRILGTRVVDEHHLTEAQLLARAREVYGSVR